jgi:ribosomal protein S12 methylthiotransferase
MPSIAPRRVHFVSLGCPKNRVDSEVMLGVAEGEGYEHTEDASSADVIVVNTCGFIEAAKQESIDTILELSQHKESGRCRKLVVTGCLSQRHGPELAEGLPEVDHFLGSSDMLKLGDVLRDRAPRVHIGNPADWVMRTSDPRRISTRGASAYVKIAEGCNRSCSFCVIPGLRGKQRSRPIDDVVSEVRALANAGVLEINLVSQDTVAYGREHGGASLTQLLQQVADVEGIRWLRVFYLYPEKLDEALIDLIAAHPKILPYIDMPLQHAADAMLRRMKRGHGGERLVKLVERLRTRLPGMVFRTAFIVGHPGESDAEFEQLCEFVRWARFDRVGVFCYSDEDTSHSATLADKVPEEVAAERAAVLMDLQRQISREKNQALVGQTLEVIVEGVSEESELVMVGRHWGQAPDIDGQVYISGGPVRPGRIYSGVVEEATDYDLMVDVGEVDEEPVAALSTSLRAPLVQRHVDGRRVLRTV